MDQERHEISLRLAERLKDTRKSKSLSLEALSSLAGVSKSMLSQIERGESSPTVATLLNLTRALNVDFAGLLDDDHKDRGPIKEVIRSEQTPVIMSKGKSCQIRVLSAPDTVGDLEIYDLQFEAHGTLESEPHSRGCLENLTVFSGELIVTTDGVSETLGAGDTVRYAADRPHSIVASGHQSRAILIVHGS
ncbi:XRE family transcriptional regulator [uncultured Litoreibacter sp.]|uniref:helix-turn-helix domain-containing protein n=1 Tax=uncultured Litoreibacter sp. TaxID=1392394 RepID=UPI00261BF4F8|nr:XRE family transcriptional regulator [uncultured Litoreibacter sp.]